MFLTFSWTQAEGEVEGQKALTHGEELHFTETAESSSLSQIHLFGNVCVCFSQLRTREVEVGGLLWPYLAESKYWHFAFHLQRLNYKVQFFTAVQGRHRGVKYQRVTQNPRMKPVSLMALHVYSQAATAPSSLHCSASSPCSLQVPTPAVCIK